MAKKSKPRAAPAARPPEKPVPETTTETTSGDPGPGADPEFELLTYDDVIALMGGKPGKRTLSRWVSEARKSDGFELIGDLFTRALLAELQEIRRRSGRRRGRPRTRGYLPPEGGGGAQ